MSAIHSDIGRGVPAYGKSRRYTVTKKYEKKGKAAGGDKKSKSAAPADAAVGRWYAGEDRATPIPSRKGNHNPTRLRESITPGTILIVLSGRFRGKRVVFLKQLDSGLLLVTGPYKINGVPLRRLNQRYVIATSASVDVSGVDASKIDDSFFKRKVTKKSRKGAQQFFARGSRNHKISDLRKDTQKLIDTEVIKSVKSVPVMREYLNARFTLTKNLLPHAIKF